MHTITEISNLGIQSVFFWGSWQYFGVPLRSLSRECSEATTPKPISSSTWFPFTSHILPQETTAKTTAAPLLCLGKYSILTSAGSWGKDERPELQWNGREVICILARQTVFFYSAPIHKTRLMVAAENLCLCIPVVMCNNHYNCAKQELHLLKLITND